MCTHIYIYIHMYIYTYIYIYIYICTYTGHSSVPFCVCEKVCVQALPRSALPHIEHDIPPTNHRVIHFISMCESAWPHSECTPSHRISSIKGGARGSSDFPPTNHLVRHTDAPAP